jgi:hypothetical protein
MNNLETRQARMTLLRFSFFPPVFFPGSLSLIRSSRRAPDGGMEAISESKAIPQPLPSKSVQSLLLAFLTVLLFSTPLISRASGVTSPEARELSGLAQVVQTYIDKNGHMPANWADVWNEDQALKAKARHPELAPLYDRYSFVANRYPIFAKSGDAAIDGTIVLMHNDVVQAPNSAGREWWFVYVTPGNRARVGTLSEEQLSSGNGVGRFRLMASDLPPDAIADFERKVVVFGYNSQHKSPGSTPAFEPTYATPPR